VFKFSQRSMQNMSGIDDSLIVIAHHALRLSSVDFGIPSTGGRRTAEQQHALYKEGKSQLDGYDSLSRHQTGRALDVFAWVDGAVSYDEHHLALVACAMLQAASAAKVPLEWGGHWTRFKDMPHFQLQI